MLVILDVTKIVLVVFEIVLFNSLLGNLSSNDFVLYSENFCLDAFFYISYYVYPCPENTRIYLFLNVTFLEVAFHNDDVNDIWNEQFWDDCKLNDVC